MKGGIFFGFFGILLINQCNCLKKDQKYNNLAGVYFNNVGTYNFVDNKDETFLTSFTLTGLENTLSNAKTYKYESLTLEENLNNIYKVCNRNRKNYLPYESTMIPENQI
uniref:Uncharacterized protein n=1 Tax=Megaselia scalaris TaxID=36166 RepID=T1GFC7_MEGSC